MTDDQSAMARARSVGTVNRQGDDLQRALRQTDNAAIDALRRGQAKQRVARLKTLFERRPNLRPLMRGMVPTRRKNRARRVIEKADIVDVQLVERGVVQIGTLEACVAVEDVIVKIVPNRPTDERVRQLVAATIEGGARVHHDVAHLLRFGALEVVQQHAAHDRPQRQQRHRKQRRHQKQGFPT